MREAPVTSGRAGARFRIRAGVGLVVAAVLMALAVALWRPVEEEVSIRAPQVRAGVPVATEPPPSALQAPRPPPSPEQEPASPAPSEDALSAALGEERVVLASSMVIEGFEKDRPWVCAGEPMSLSARLGGVREPGAVYRWVWPTLGGGAELHPGPTLQWRAPETAGRYRLRFQVCKDLGGRRVGVLAEREVELEVRRCAGGEGQEQEPLRLVLSQRRNGAFAFEALYQGRERVTAYVWDFGDGATATTTEPEVEHAYALQELGPQEVRSFTVKLVARRERGGPLEATAFALTRGQPPSDEPPPVALEISRWRPRPEGGGWQSELVVSPPSETDVTWERLERVTVDWEGEVRFSTRSWREVIHVEEELERGGFRGHVLVSPAEAAPETKQILDSLYGRDATGQEVVVSWSPYKSEAPPGPPQAPPADAPPRK